MDIWLKYVTFGITLAISLGPVNFELIKQGVTKGFLPSWLVGLGAASGDFLMILCIYLGLGHVFAFKGVQIILGLIGAFMLIWMGFQNIKDRKVSETVVFGEKGSFSKKQKNTYMTGLLLAISNPLNIVFWTGIYSSLMLESTKSGIPTANFLFIFFGIIISNIIMAFLSSLGKEYMKPSYLQILSVVSGWVLIGYGVWIGYSASISTLIF